MRLTGWLLDVYIRGDQAILWVRTLEGAVARLVDSYNPDFYVTLKGGIVPEEAAAIMSEHPHVLDAFIERKYTSVTEREKAKVVRVVVDGAQSFKGVLRDFDRLGYVKEWFNVDILHVQRYLFGRGFAPTQRLEFDSDGSLRRTTVVDDESEIRPPPFTSLLFELEVRSEALTPDPEKDPIAEVSILDEDLKTVEAIKGGEEAILDSFAERVQSLDPDFLVAPDLDEFTLPYLVRRAQILGSDVSLGREPGRLRDVDSRASNALPGRVGLELGDFCQEGIEGIVEESRFTMAPPGLASRWPAGRRIDSRQCYEALKRDILIPKLRSPPMKGTAAKELVFMDRGGLILSPVAGLHENVACLDFESMFPNILVRYNISYETVDSKGIEGSRRGFLGEFTRRFLERRLYFKHLRSKYQKGSQEWLWCERRQSALKRILVCIYGFSGCDVNRYGNVYTYAKINEVSKEVLVRALGVCRSLGFRVLYADCDSLFVQRKGASREDYEGLAKRIQAESGLPIALDQHFKFLVLLKREGDPSIEAVRHYFGKLTSGELFYRGVELRRRDFPPFLKEFEARLMGILFEAESEEEVMGRQYERARDYVVKAVEELASGEVPPGRLVIRKMLRKPIGSYRALFPHVSAAIQMVQRGKRFKERCPLRESQPIDFVYMNAEHPNPLRRVMPAQLINDDHRYYDREKYKEMLLDVAETILGWNGFTRAQQGYKPRSRDFLRTSRRKGEGKRGDGRREDYPR